MARFFEHNQETPAEYSARGQLKTLKAERKRLEDEIKKLDDSIGRTQADYGIHRNVRLSRTANLPSEILAMIFEFACHLTRRPTRMELVLSHICSRWRDVALEIPTLWTTIELSSIRRSDGFNEYMERARTQNVDVTINFGGDANAIYWIWKRIDKRNILERCRSLTLVDRYEPHATAYPVLKYLHRRSMPVLERFSTEIKIPTDDNTYIPPFSIFSGGAPRLKFLLIHGYSLRGHLPPLSGLTTVHIHHIDICVWTNEEFIMFVEKLTSLERLSLEGHVVEVRSNNMSLPTLRELRLRSHSTFPTLKLSNIIAPNLHTLHLYDCIEPSVAYFASAYLGTTPFPKLKHLIIEISEERVTYDKNASILRILSMIFPSVKHLTWINNLRHVHMELCDPDVWPEIESVRFWVRGNQDMYLGELLNMLMCRDKASRPIPTLCVPHRPPLFPKWVLTNAVASLKINQFDPPAQWPEWITL